MNNVGAPGCICSGMRMGSRQEAEDRMQSECRMKNAGKRIVLHSALALPSAFCLPPSVLGEDKLSA